MDPISQAKQQSTNSKRDPDDALAQPESLLPFSAGSTSDAFSSSTLFSPVPSFMLGREEQWNNLYEAYLQQTVKQKTQEAKESPSTAITSTCTTSTAATAVIAKNPPNLENCNNENRPQLILITGPSGTGKTALVKQFLSSLHSQQQQRPHIVSKCFYGTGKFDLLNSASSLSANPKQQQQQPFIPFVQAMHEFIHQLTPSEVKYFQNKIQNQQRKYAKDANRTPLDVDLLVHMIPDLSILLHSENLQQQQYFLDNLAASASTIYKENAKDDVPHRPSVQRRQDQQHVDVTTVKQQPLSDVHRRRFLRALSHFLAILFLNHDNKDSSDPLHRCSFILFLDDLQWADMPSLELLHHLVLLQHARQKDVGIGGLIMMGACRGNEVTVHDDLSFMLRSLEEPKNNTNIVEISLSNWTLEETNKYIETQLSTSSSTPLSLSSEEQNDYETLSTMIYQQTKGNIFFVRQCLVNLLDRKIIYPQSSTGNEENEPKQYGWNVEAVKEYLTNNETVVDLVSFDLRQSFSESSLELLKISSCLGATFDEELLQWILDDMSTTVSSSSSAAATAPVPIISHFLDKQIWVRKQEEATTTKKLHQPREGLLCFRHDQIQLACYNLIPQSQQAKFHLDLGMRLKKILEVKDEEKPQNSVWDRHLFVLASQFVCGLHKIDPAQVYETSLLCLQAGQKAVSLASFGTASAYIDAGIKCLGSQAFDMKDDKFYLLSLTLYNAAAEIANCNGEYEYMEYLVGQVLKNAKSYRDSIQVYSTQIVALGSRNRLQEAIETGFCVLRLLGEPVPHHKAVLLNGAMEFIRTKRMLKSLSARDILNLPLMTNHDKVTALKILDLIFPYVFLGKPEYAPYTGCRMVQLTMKHGLNVLSGPGFVLYAILLASDDVWGNRSDAYKYGRIGLQIMKKFENKCWYPRVLCGFNAMILPWREPFVASLQPLKEAFLLAQKTGDFEMSAMAGYLYSINSYFAGMSINQQFEDAKGFLHFMVSFQQETVLAMLTPFVQFLANMRGLNETNPFELHGEYVDEEKHFRECSESNNVAAEFMMEVSRLLLAFHAGQYERAERIYNRMRKHVPDRRCDLSRSVILHIGATTSMILYRLEQQQKQQNKSKKVGIQLITSRPNDKRTIDRRQRKRIVLARGNLKRMKKLAEDAPCNFLQLIYFLEAEMEACQIQRKRGGGLNDAMTQYHLAIRFAEREGFVHHQALFNERMAQTFLSESKTVDAIRCFERSRDLYAEWGAVISVNRLNDILCNLHEKTCGERDHDDVWVKSPPLNAVK